MSGKKFTVCLCDKTRREKVLRHTDLLPFDFLFTKRKRVHRILIYNVFYGSSNTEKLHRIEDFQQWKPISTWKALHGPKRLSAFWRRTSPEAVSWVESQNLFLCSDKTSARTVSFLSLISMKIEPNGHLRCHRRNQKFRGDSPTDGNNIFHPKMKILVSRFLLVSVLECSYWFDFFHLVWLLSTESTKWRDNFSPCNALFPYQSRWLSPGQKEPHWRIKSQLNQPAEASPGHIKRLLRDTKSANACDKHSQNEKSPGYIADDIPQLLSDVADNLSRLKAWYSEQMIRWQCKGRLLLVSGLMDERRES